MLRHRKKRPDGVTNLRHMVAAITARQAQRRRDTEKEPQNRKLPTPVSETMVVLKVFPLYSAILSYNVLTLLKTNLILRVCS